MYAKANGEVEQYRLLYAKLIYRDAKEVSNPNGDWYLDGYCDRSSPKSELPELSHNRSFLWRRLQDVIAVPIEGEWRQDGLATLVLALRLSGGLAHNYTPQAERDIPECNRWLDGSRREVAWQVHSYLWAKRQLFRYGSSCEVVGPTSFRQAIAQEITAMAKLYVDLTLPN